ncbi:creatininase family protein [Chloroflexota bacterium]
MEKKKGDNSQMGYSLFDETMVDMSWPGIEKSARQGAIVLLPVGIIEEHGPHMGLAVDTCVACLLAKMARKELESRKIKTLIAPPYYWGISSGTSTFAGTFSVRKETMKALIYDILASLKGWGLNRVFTVNWHADYDHVMTLLETVKEARINTGIEACSILTDFDVRRFRLTGREDHIIVRKMPPPQQPPPQYVDIHAGSLETGIMMKYFPDQVDAELARTLKRTELSYRDLKVLGSGTSDEIRKQIPGGYFGDPASYDVEAAERFIEGNALDIANLIESFLKGSYRPPEVE